MAEGFMTDKQAISQLIPLEIALSDDLRSLLSQLLRRAAPLARADRGLAACVDVKNGRIEILSTLNLPEAAGGPAVIRADSPEGKRLLVEGWTRRDLFSPDAVMALTLSVPAVDPSAHRAFLRFEWPADADVPDRELRAVSDILGLSTRVVFNMEKARRYDRLRQQSPVKIEPVADEGFDEPRMELLLKKIVERLAAQFPGCRIALLLRASKAGDLALLRTAFLGEPVMTTAEFPRLLRRRRPTSTPRDPEQRCPTAGPAGIPFYAFDTGRTYLVADLAHASRGGAFFKGSLSAAAVPILLGHERLGVMILEAETTATFGKPEALQLESLARDVAVYFAKAAAYEESRRENARDPVLLVGTPRDVIDQAVAAAGVSATVLVEGESGTGKEMLARFIHRVGPRRDRPFLTLNCSEVNPTLAESHLFGHVKGAFTGAERDARGIFEQAGEGTVFIDEVDTLSLNLQSKLLRVLERAVISPLGSGGAERLVRARVVVATNKNLEQFVADGKFLKDLFYRLDVLRLHVPTLRSYPESIPRIAQVLMREMAERNERKAIPFTPLAERMLREYSFPGNVRELRNAMEHSVIRDRDGRLDIDDLPPTVLASGHLRLVPKGEETTVEWTPVETPSEEAKAIVDALRGCQGNVLRTAQHLGIDRRQFYRLLRRYRIDPAAYRK
jgi:DNA-binding NtrC family response regulator